MSEITRILSEIEDGNGQAAEKLLPLIYDELRKLAPARMSQESPGQTLQATTLVHEAYIRLVDQENAQNWDGRAHFFAAASEAMRRIVVESARRKRRLKRGGKGKQVDVDVDRLAAAINSPSKDVLALDEALVNLGREHSLEAALVKLRYFCGMSIAEAAEALGISSDTAKRKWVYARAWLYRELTPEDSA